MHIFFVIFYQPIFNLLVFLYNTISFQDLGIAIIFLTLIIRLILYPLSKQAIKSQKAMQTIQPEIDAIKEKYKSDKEKMGPEIMALYKEKKINPFGSCLPLLVQLPFLIAIYRVFFNELKDGGAFNSEALYSFVANPGTLDPIAFGFLNLAEKSIWIALIAGAAQFWQSKMMMAKTGKTKNAASTMTQQMTYIMPIVTVFIGSRFPAGLTFYWLLTTLFSVFQQYMVIGFKKPTKGGSASGGKKPAVEVVDKK